MNVYYELEIFGKKGSRKTKKRQSRSFLKPFLYLLCPCTGGSGITTVDIDNVGHTPGNDDMTFSVLHPGKQTYMIFRWGDCRVNRVGIQVGTGTNAVTINDYKLQTPIVHGYSSGEFVHYGTNVYNYVVGGSSASFDIEKIFYNDSGGSITVNEIGLYAMHIPSTPENYCIIRDKLSSGTAVADTEYLKVKYTITVSV